MATVNTCSACSTGKYGHAESESQISVLRNREEIHLLSVSH